MNLLRRPKACLLALFMASAAAHASASNQVFVVGATPGPGIDFTSVDAAVAAASEGDYVLVRGTTMPQYVEIAGKSVSIVAEPDGSGLRPKLSGFAVWSLAEDQSVTVRGFDLDGVGSVFGARVEIADCAGTVVVEDCEVLPSALQVFANVSFRVTNSEHVVFTRCRHAPLDGSYTSDGIFDSVKHNSPALVVATSNVFLYGGTWKGGRGTPSYVPIHSFVFFAARDGEPGIRLDSGFLFVSGAEVTGGDGGAGYLGPNHCGSEGDGAPAIANGGTVILQDCDLAGGAAGAPANGCAGTGVAGGTVSGPGNVSTQIDLARDLEITSPGIEGQSLTVTLRGQPGEFALMIRSENPTATYIPSLHGGLIEQFPLTLIPIGNLPPSGELSFGFTISAGVLPPSIDAVGFHHQFVVAGATGNGLLSSPSYLAIFNDSL